MHLCTLLTAGTRLYSADGAGKRILVFEMVHRTHLRIFGGLHYAPWFSNWWSDDWINSVYGKDRTRRVAEVTVKHFLKRGGHAGGTKTARYSVQMAEKARLYELALAGRVAVAQYIARL